jgi:hypothetical protein
MSLNEQSLWHKIKEFPLDDTISNFTFSDRLARENGWTKSYTLRVVEEYRKFLFLCCITETGVTPSDPVDQAWHLHLTYTRSYWIDLCRNTLEKEIHHNPTMGGKKESKKFDNFYTTTNQLYKEKFGVAPPEDIWPDNHIRFADIHFQRINLRQYWIIKKPLLRTKRSIVISGMIIVALLSIQATFDFSNYIFIGFLILMGITIFNSKKNKGKGGDSSGCSTSSCSSDSGHSNHNSDNGCSSGCSGCSGSGCSGCGGGGD